MSFHQLQLLRQEYKNNCRSQSNNAYVLELYAYILRHEYIDSDFWTAGNGFEQITCLLAGLNDNDWRELAEDLPHWTGDQQEIFCEGVLTVDYYHQSLKDDERLAIEKRFGIIPVLMQLETGDVLSRCMGDFIRSYFDKINAHNPEIITAITRIKKWNAEQMWVNLQTGERVEGPDTNMIEAAFKKVMTL